MASPILLVADLGRPERFYNMLRVFKPSSPMSVGSWVLAVFAPGRRRNGGPRPAGLVPAAADGRRQRPRRCSGPVLATYTAVLFADTAVPVWHEAHRELPAVFAGSALASAGAAAVIGLPTGSAGPARRAVVDGRGRELGAVAAMERALGPLAAPYRDGPGWSFRPGGEGAHRAAAQRVVATLGRSRRWAAIGGGLRCWPVPSANGGRFSLPASSRPAILAPRPARSAPDCSRDASSR